ncbi:hypothetical protein TRV_02406 [Trichophyton verrucosum HKI 0517]|uniref:Uncharacterized protein n=1 Tax=Trichophyton verrucosum (strain HKI 0517) TaxID=663202 RepID=D4D5N3_TRIVH|nr:uncharacterized protein TRV_02406 [Trichophyton verrucosum HKI 0517]EFE42834.1 hypothetical protein TRV_02406 [Trichophyton verrucosum HKI 0517]
MPKKMMEKIEKKKRRGGRGRKGQEDGKDIGPKGYD